MLRTAGNFIWFICAGFWLGIIWWITGALMYVFVITIPWGKAAFILGKFSFLPFGRELVNRSDITGTKDIGTGKLGLLGNIIWFICAGFWLACANVVVGFIWCCTIIGIPLGVQCFKLAGASLAPIGKTVISNEVAAELRKTNASKELERLQSQKPEN